MQKNCKSCNENFAIRNEDLIFYDQIKVSSPNFCPECRVQKRIAFRNERTLYKRPCDLCKKDIIAIYPADAEFPVYCYPCWWSDAWDPASYAIDYDEDKSIFTQIIELQKKVPRIALTVINNVNSDYVNNSADNKNCYLIFAAENNEDCAYSRLIMKSKNVFDCASTYESELCYELLDCRGCFKCLFSERLQDCVDVLFSFDMRNCQNCILCTNGRNLSYCIENVQYDKEEFEKKKKEILLSHDSIQKAKEKYARLREKAVKKYAFSVKSHNSTGDYMYNCHGGVNLFDVRNSKNSSYMADAEDPIDCHDCNNTYYKAERCYNMMGNLQSSKCLCGFFIFYSNEVLYSDSCHHSSSCFACNGLKKKSYCILNKQYTKEEYEKLKEKIIESLKREKFYGDFMPPELSPFGYNETLAQEYFPLTEQEAKKQGFNWQNQTTGTYGKETITEEVMPETISEVTEDILNQVLVCSDCKKNFRITRAEFDFYKRMNLPLPHKDFECRHQDRMKKRNPRKLWPRACMCSLLGHLHGTNKCSNEFETSYSPERTETIYCEHCYQQEVS